MKIHKVKGCEVIDLTVYEDFLSEEEINDIIEHVKDQEGSVANTFGYDPDGVIIHSENKEIRDAKVNIYSGGKYHDLIVDRATNLLSADYAIPGSQVINYGPGGHYVPHHDSTPPESVRFFSFLIYLNDDFTGGETHFPRLDWKSTPKKGSAISWMNVRWRDPEFVDEYIDKTMHEPSEIEQILEERRKPVLELILESEHAGLEVKSGNKLAMLIIYEDEQTVENTKRGRIENENE